MSEELRIALVAEGPTDRVVIESAVESMLGGRPFILRQVQPEESAAFGPIGTGWAGVHRWCKQAVVRAGGSLRNDPLFREFQLLILHIDADVADMCYADGNIEGEPNDLPCARPCPPPSDTTNELRNVLLRWAGEASTPPRVVLCTPSKSTEAWVLAAVFPEDQAIAGLECHPNPAGRLTAQPANVRIRKKKREYDGVRKQLITAWPNVAATLSEAARFDADFSTSVAALSQE